MTERFSTRLRQATWATHGEAESSGLVDALLAGRLDRPSYTAMVVTHHAIYQALEEAGEVMRHDPIAGAFVDDALLRTAALERDLAYLLGADWRALAVVPEATRGYVERIRAVCFTWPAGFVAHHYTRYLGDLSGGLRMGHALAKHYGYASGSGGDFYVFAGIPDPAGFKRAYRERLDTADWDERERDRLVAEVSLAYRLNIEAFAELDGAVPDRVAPGGAVSDHAAGEVAA